MDLKKWNLKNSCKLMSVGTFNLLKSNYIVSRTGKEHEFFLIDTPDWVNIVAIVDNKNLLMIKQYRVGTDNISLEIPGGILDSKEEPPMDAAKRELMEETGYSGPDFKLIGTLPTNPAFQTNYIHIFKVDEAKQTGVQDLDETEEISIELVSLELLPDMIKNGKITQVYTITSLYLSGLI